MYNAVNIGIKENMRTKTRTDIAIKKKIFFIYIYIVNNKRATARSSGLINFFSFDGILERPFVLPLAFSSAVLPRLLVTSE